MFTVPKIPYQNFWAHVTSVGDMRSSTITKNVRVILVGNEPPSWNVRKKTASLYELRLNLGALKCLRYLFYPNRAAFLSTRTIFTRARTTSPKVPARVKILVRHGWNLVRTGCLHCKFYPSRTFIFGTCANFTRAVPKIFCSVNRAVVYQMGFVHTTQVQD